MTKRAFRRSRLGRMHEVPGGHVEAGRVPGFVLAVARRDDVHVHASGRTAFGDGGALDEGAIFRLASLSKPITAVATLMLIEECALRLEDPVDAWLPELANRRVVRDPAGPIDDTVSASRPILVRDLLTFTMGFGAYFGPSPLFARAATQHLTPGPPAPQAPAAPDEWISQLGALPLLYHPGERWLYHTGSDVLGVLIARVAGVPFSQFLTERVFGPLGMADTGFVVPPWDRPRLVSCYAPNTETGELELYDSPDGQWATPPAFPSGGAGLVGTARDYLAFARAVAAGGAGLLGPASVRAMTQNQLTDSQRALSGFSPDYFSARGWGYGVQVVTTSGDPTAPAGQYGWNGGLGTTWVNDPAEELSAVLLTNVAWSSVTPPAIARDFLTLTYAALTD